MFSNDRAEMRKFFRDAWTLKRQGQALEPLQQMIVSVIDQHPEYHELLQNRASLDKDFDPARGESNPYLHMSMHIALIEQISTNRPEGIRKIYQQLVSLKDSNHDAEHSMMECLAQVIWQAQRDNAAPDEAAYLACLKNLVNTD
jgi:hypothetical protein